MMKEPSTAALSGDALPRMAKRLFFATRPMFFSASILPVLLGTAWGYRAGGHLDGGVFILTVAAIMCVHAAGNVLNDVYDDLSGTDRINENRIFPFTGGSRFIQNGVMTRRQMTIWGLVLLGLGGVLGVALVVLKGAGLLFIGLAGMALFVLYLVPPLHLSARGLGEFLVGLGFGVLPVTAAAWLQAGVMDARALLISLPVALWIASVLLINEVPDAAADGGTGKRTLVVILGRDGTRRLYLALNGLAVIAVLAAVGAEFLPPGAAVGPAALCLAAPSAARTLRRNAGGQATLTRGIKITLVIHSAGTLWLAAWVWLG